MARTEQAATLTEQHRQAQLQVRSHALRNFLLLWPIWRPEDPASFGRLVTATLPLVRAYNRVSSSLAGSYYQAFRTAEGVLGVATPRLAGPIATAQVTASLYVTGQVMTRDAIAAGRTVEQAREAALVRTSGAVTRHTLQGGRDTMLQSVAADKQALGWARVTDGNPCAFCLTLASRGAVYKTEQSASFLAHDHCGCSVESVYDGTALPPLTQQWKDIYNQAQREALAAGELQHGANSSAARINAVRRLLVNQ